MVAALDSAGFDALEADIYEAAFAPERWVGVLDRLARVAGGVGGTLWSSRDGTSAWTASTKMAPITKRFVAGGWGLNNPRYQAACAKGLNHAPRFVTEADLFDSPAFAEHPFFAEFMIPEGLGWSASTAVTVPDHDLLALSIERAWKDGPIPPDRLTVLDRLRPHLARSAIIAGRLAFERVSTAVDTLAQLGFAATAISTCGKMLLANREFESGEGREWVQRAGDHIDIADGTADALMKDSLARLSASSGVRSIPVRPPGGKVGAVIHLVPIRHSEHDLFARAAAILIVTRSTRRLGSPALIQALFDLTPSEALIARRLSAGETAEEIARATSKSVLTIRTQLKSVLAKTGTRRQSELVQLLARLVPPAL